MTAATLSPVPPKVSVCVISYNHEKYLSQCLQSIVDQRTTFPFEVIVGDDCSTDGTPQIIREFSERYPGLFVSIINLKKIGGTQNYVTTHLRARGEYVAHIDGDDVAYPGKLQRQVDYLDSNDRVTLVWHGMEFFNDAGKNGGQVHRHIHDIINTKNILKNDILRFGPLGAASSVMYRRAFEDYLCDIQTDTLDFYFAARLLEHGPGARIDEILGGYRLNPTTVTLSRSKFNYFQPSPMRMLYASHLSSLYSRDRRTRDDIFLNSLFNFVVELKFLRPSVSAFLLLALRTMTWSGVRQVPEYFGKAFRLRKR